MASISWLRCSWVHPWGSLAQWTLGHLCLWPGNFRRLESGMIVTLGHSDVRHIDSPLVILQGFDLLKILSILLPLRKIYTSTQTQIKPSNLSNIQWFSALCCGVAYVHFTHIQSVAAGLMVAEVASWSGHLVLCSSQEIYVNHWQSQQIMLTKQGPLLRPWGILKWSERFWDHVCSLPQVTEKTIMYHYVQLKVVSQVPLESSHTLGSFC